MKRSQPLIAIGLLLAMANPVYAIDACRMGRVCTLRAATIGCRATPDVVHEIFQQSKGEHRAMADLDLSRFLAVSICRPLRAGVRVVPMAGDATHKSFTMVDEPDTQLFTLDVQVFN